MDACRWGLTRVATLFTAALLVDQAAVRTVHGAAPVTTQNFVIHAPNAALARRIGSEAERFRKELAIEWLGHELPVWKEKCPIQARIARGAGGETSFYFTRGRVHGWKMYIQGSPQRMLDSVLPHEVTHTIFATHFRRPLPRWADEGACTTVEHPGEIARMEDMLITFLKTKRGIRFSDMMWMKQYPRDPGGLMPLYAQGHSVAQYLIHRKDKRAFIRFIKDGLEDDNWPRAVRAHYEYANLVDMQNDWLDWIKAGRPSDLSRSLASTSNSRAEEDVIRGQEPSQQQPLAAAAARSTPPRREPVLRVASNAVPADTAPAQSTSPASGQGRMLFEWRSKR